MGCTWATPVMRYGNVWRTHRRLFHRFFNVSTASRFDDKIHVAVRVLLRRLSETPERFLKHAHLYVVLAQSSRCLGLTTSFLAEKPYRVSDPIDCVRGEHRI